MLGMDRFPGTDTVRNLLKRFTQPVIEAFWRPLWRWLLEQGWAVPAPGWSLDLDCFVPPHGTHRFAAAFGWLSRSAWLHGVPAPRSSGRCGARL